MKIDINKEPIIVLDTSALLALKRNEPERPQVEAIIMRASSGKCLCYVSLMTLMEAYYIITQDSGEQDANYFVSNLEQLPMRVYDLNVDLMRVAGRAKVKNHRS